MIIFYVTLDYMLQDKYLLTISGDNCILKILAVTQKYPTNIFKTSQPHHQRPISQRTNIANMADAQEASGSTAPPTEAVAKLLLDEATGEMVSKTELKKREKLRKKEEEKKAKEAAAPPKPAKKTNAEADEKDLNPNVSI
jgi:hypothetical protein